MSNNEEATIWVTIGGQRVRMNLSDAIRLIGWEVSNEPSTEWRAD